jgi:chaperonin GroES
MAGAANRIADMVAEVDPGGEDAPRADAPHPAEILEPGVNLAEHLTDNEITKIGQHVIRDVEIDERSRGKGSGEKARTATGWPATASGSTWPCRSGRQEFPVAARVERQVPAADHAAVQFQARAYPAIVDGSNLVKGRVLGPDPDGQKPPGPSASAST